MEAGAGETEQRNNNNEAPVRVKWEKGPNIYPSIGKKTRMMIRLKRKYSSTNPMILTEFFSCGDAALSTVYRRGTFGF